MCTAAAALPASNTRLQVQTPFPSARRMHTHAPVANTKCWWPSVRFQYGQVLRTYCMAFWRRTESLVLRSMTGR